MILMPRMIIIVDATIVIVVTGVTWGVGCQMVANVLSLTLCSPNLFFLFYCRWRTVSCSPTKKKRVCYQQRRRSGTKEGQLHL
ncbi:MAG: hypothetical protein JOS17DRAFT_766865 [Linnemannia elongata]|nr:MAG: hypothetical protein JOS17DRAFT_766865 [Linnemannia elongata]